MGGTETLSGRLGDWVASLTCGAIPPRARREAVRCIVDLVGVTLAGATHPTARAIRYLAYGTYAAGAASVVGGEKGLVPAGAALANAVAGHVLDYDDTSYTGILHASVVVFPAVLAVAEEHGSSGEEALTAFVAGVETVYALGRLVTDHLYMKGVFTTSALGTVGAAAGVAKVLGLDARRTANTVALAATRAAGGKAAFGASSKPFLVGFAAEAGVTAARAAEAGLEAPGDYLEAPGGFLQVLNDGIAKAGALDRLGDVYGLVDPGIVFKLHPVCSAALAATDETAETARKEGIAPEDVERILCEVTPLVVSCLRHRLPETVEQARFSMAFPVASALRYGDAGLARLSAETLADPAFRALMEKVEMRVAPELDRTPDALKGREESAYVTIVTRDGKSPGRRYRASATGTPANPASDQVLEEKFKACAAFANRPPGAVRALLETLRNFRFLDSVRGVLG